MGGAGEVGGVGIDLRADGVLAGEVGGVVLGIGSEELGKAETTEGEGGVGHEVTAAEEIAAEGREVFRGHDR